MKVIITEKPSVARDIAAVWGITGRREGYLEGRGCAITWAFGHLVTLKEPDEYDPALKRWSLQTLPFIPQAFELKLIAQKGVKEQFEVIRSLLNQSDDIICATDAGREGELIFRYVMKLAGCEQRPFRRLWLNSLTAEAVREAFAQLRDGREYDALYAAARSRSEADWIVGLNATRCFTVRYGHAAGGNNVLWTVGRVQTPVLALIVRRDDDIADFKPQAFWELITKYRGAAFKYTGERFDSPGKAEALLQRVQGRPFTITGVKGNQKTDKPPQLYDLTTLQRDMNKRFQLSAARTLEIAQKLYEGKFLTYPRTDSRYINADMKPRVADTLKQLAALRPEQIAPLRLDRLPFTKRIVDDTKVSDHHAILPTGILPKSLERSEQQVYDAVVTQLIAAFYPDCVKEITTADGVSADVPFQAKGTRIVQAGWTVLYPAPKKEEGEQELPVFSAGETGPHEPSVREGKTKPPARFTENSLLAAMESAGKLVEDEALREALKERGLGTPATRAAIIEILLKRNYIRRDKKTIVSTDMGMLLISLIHDRLLKSPEMTGEWEEKLKKIERGLLGAESFAGDVKDYTSRLIEEARRFQVDAARWGVCPLCGAEVVAGSRGYGCSKWKEGCSFVLWREYRGAQLAERQIRELLQHGVSLTPVQIPGEGPRAVRLTAGGHVMDLACPRREEQSFGKDTAAPKKRTRSDGHTML